MDFLIRGNLAGDWEGLNRSEVIATWNFDKRDLSLKFLADRGHRQLVAGCFDGRPEQGKEWLASAAKLKGVFGVMCPTWKDRWEDLEAFARATGE